jgi:alkaline phosphatase
LDRRKLFPEQPTLSDMTQKAIELLSKNPKGFFLFVEGSKVDWASHANDPVGVISDVLAFDEAVKVALAFSRKNKQTLLLAFSDHGNGGMSIGNKATDGTYSNLPYEAVFTALKKAQLTGEGIGMVISKNSSEENIKKTMSEYYGIDDLTQEDVKSIKESTPKSMNRITGAIISRKANIGWSTHGHTGEDLFFYTYGLKKGMGTINNTDIARITAKGMGFDLAIIDRKLFVDAEEAFRKLGAITKISHIDSNNPMLIVERQGKYAELPFSKDIVRLGPEKKGYRLQGVTIFSPLTKRVFVPRDAISLLSWTLN